MSPFTSNYETINETSSQDKSVDVALISGDMTTPSQGKIQSTFLQSVLSNKFSVVLVVVLLGAGLVAYHANPGPSSHQLRFGDYAASVNGNKGGGFSGAKNGGITGEGNGRCSNNYCDAW